MVWLKRFRFNSQRLSTLLLILLVIKSLSLPLVSLAEKQALNVELVGRLTGGIPYGVFVKDNHAYVAALSILSIIDVSDPHSPKEVKRVWPR